jgi:hypothetical protein
MDYPIYFQIHEKRLLKASFYHPEEGCSLSLSKHFIAGMRLRLLTLFALRLTHNFVVFP